MKIKEYAEKNGLSKAQVYYSIRNSRFNMAQITNKAGEITAEGQKILQILFSEEPETEPEAGNLRRDDDELQRITDALREAERERDALRAELDALRTQLDAEKERSALFERLYTEERENHQKAVEAADRARERADLLLSREQENHRLFLMNPIKRLFAGRQREPVTVESQVK